MKLSPNLRSPGFKEFTVLAGLGLSALYLSHTDPQITQATANTKSKISDTLDPKNNIDVKEQNVEFKGKAGILDLLGKLEEKLKVYANDQRPFTKDILGQHGEKLKLSIEYGGQKISLIYGEEKEKKQKLSIKLTDFKEKVLDPQAGLKARQFLEAFSKDQMLFNKDDDFVRAIITAQTDVFNGGKIDKIIGLFNQNSDPVKKSLTADDIMIAILKTIHDQI